MQTVYAFAFPAEINKQFTPILIDSGGISVLRVTVFNPNTFPLTNASWTDNLAGIQSGLSIAPPGLVNNTCGGTVTAAPGTTTLALSNGTVPAQVQSTPGECYVEINVTSLTPGNLINTIPAGNLRANGNDGGTPVDITNTTPASATLTVVALAPPTLSKVFNPKYNHHGRCQRAVHQDQQQRLGYKPDRHLFYRYPARQCRPCQPGCRCKPTRQLRRFSRADRGARRKYHHPDQRNRYPKPGLVW